MDPKKFASVFGGACLAVGLLSLIPSFVGSAAGLPELSLPVSYGTFLGLFPMNVMNKGCLITIGILGLISAGLKFNALPGSIRYARAMCLLTGTMAVLGMLPQTNTLFGVWPLFGSANVMTSMLFAVISGAFGFYLTSKVRDSGPAIRDFTTTVTR